MNSLSQTIRLEKLTEENFEAFSSFINCEDDGCYCSFWHQKISSMEEWDQLKSKTPEKNKSCLLEKVRSRFHVGVLAYQGSELVAWISVGPAIDFYWAWRRITQLGDSAKTVAIIPCITRKTELRNQITETELLLALKDYAKTQGWSAIEGYPFNRETLDRLGESFTWPGYPEDFEKAGFKRIGDHWLNSKEYSRSIYRVDL
jgi:hypothetical protein